MIHCRLTFCGRVDRLLKVRGHRVQPEEVEHVLEQRGEIDEAAVVKHRQGDVEVPWTPDLQFTGWSARKPQSPMAGSQCAAPGLAMWMCAPSAGPLRPW